MAIEFKPLEEPKIDFKPEEIKEERPNAFKTYGKMLKDAFLNPLSPPPKELAQEFEQSLQIAGQDVRGMGEAIIKARDKFAEFISKDPGDPKPLPMPEFLKEPVEKIGKRVESWTADMAEKHPYWFKEFPLYGEGKDKVTTTHGAELLKTITGLVYVGVLTTQGIQGLRQSIQMKRGLKELENLTKNLPKVEDFLSKNAGINLPKNMAPLQKVDTLASMSRQYPQVGSLMKAASHSAQTPVPYVVGEMVKFGDQIGKLISITGNQGIMATAAGQQIPIAIDLLQSVKEPKPQMVTQDQKRNTHLIAKKKGLITPKGKTTPGYRKIAKVMTGKTSMKNMTQEEADVFTDALEKVSEPRYKKGKMVPPSIATSTKLAKPELFEQKFKTPTPAKFLTSQTRYAELLGIKKLVKPMEIGKQNLDLEYAELTHQTDKVISEMKKAKVNTKSMAKLLNTQEEAPPNLSEKSKQAFNYFRDLSRDLIKRENEVRASLELDPIPYRQAYYRHIADKMSDEVIQGKHPLPEGLKYWSEQTIGKKVYNPMEMQRKLKDDLLKKFSSDLSYVTKAMTWTALKEIHLSIPKNILNKELGILSKDKLVYKSLTPQERKVYDAQMTMPASTKKWLLDYVNIALGSRQSALDESVNRWIVDSPIKDVANSVLKPFGKHIGQRPMTMMLSAVSKLPIYGAMSGINPRQLVRNKFQTLQNVALYGFKNTIKGYTPTSSYPVLEELKTDSLFKKSYTGFEDLPLGLRNKIEKLSLAPYQWTAISNVSQTMNCAYHWTADNIQNPRKAHLGWADPQRTYKEDKNFFYPSEKEKLSKEMEYGAHTTQYQYIGLGMPEMFRHKTLAPLTRLQSWWMNHWFVFHREAATRAFAGQTGYDENLKVTLGDRMNYLKYLIIGGAILVNLGYERSYLLGTAPTGVPPTAQLMMGLYEYFTSYGDSSWQKRKRAMAKRKMIESIKIHVPGYLSTKDTLALIKGDKHWTEYLFYKKRGATELEKGMAELRKGKAEYRVEREKLRTKIAKGKATQKDIIEAVENGVIKAGKETRDTRKNINEFIQSATLPDDIRTFKNLSSKEQYYLYTKKMTNEEKRKFYPYARKNVQDLLDRIRKEETKKIDFKPVK